MKAADTIKLFDQTGIPVGCLCVEEEKYGALCGRFTPSADYDRFRQPFEKFASLVESMSLAYIDEAEEGILSHGIYGVAGDQRIPIFDLQIYGDRASLRLSPKEPWPNQSIQGTPGKEPFSTTEPEARRS